jgi:hypothetical protein
MAIHVEGLANTDPEVYATCLDRGDYDVVVQSADEFYSSKGSQGIKFDLLVEEGPMQIITNKAGEIVSERSPVGRHIFASIYLPTSSQKDGGAFCKTRLATVMDVFEMKSDDIELQDAIGKRCRVRNVPKESSNGALYDDIVQWKSIE